MYLKTRVPFFKNYDMQTLKGVARYVRRRVFAEGHFLYEQGEAADEIYLLMSGQICVFCHEEPKESRVMLKKHTVFGDQIMKKNAKRDASCVAMEPVICWSVGGAEFRDQYFNMQWRQKQARLEFLR